MKKPFDQWYEELRLYAKRKSLSSLLGNDKESYREAYEDGMSPRKTFNEIADAACANVL